jgi:hypothetical protein
MTLVKKTLRWLVLAAVVMPLQTANAVMVARWTLDDDTAGLVNQGTDGATSDLVAATPSASIGGGPTFTATGGILNGYATFDGNQALIAAGAGNAGDDLTAYPFTLSAWVRPAAHPSTPTLRGAAVAIGNSTAASTYYTLGIEANNNATENSDIQGVRRNTTFTSTEGIGTAATASNGNWHHIAVVNLSDTNSRLYMDGVQVGISNSAVSFSNTVNITSIGGFLRSAGWIDKFYGDIDDVQIYNEGLIASQVQYLFNNIVGPPPPVAPCDVDLANGCTLADLQIIANNFFTNVTDRSMGDLNSDGIVNFADFRIWKDASGSAATLESLWAPEPTSLGLIMVALTCWCVRRSGR